MLALGLLRVLVLVTPYCLSQITDVHARWDKSQGELFGPFHIMDPVLSWGCYQRRVQIPRPPRLITRRRERFSQLQD